MIEIATFIHYLTIGCIISLTAIGVGIGQGITSVAALRAINLQPAAKNDIMKTVILGIALIETAAVMGLFIAFLLVLEKTKAADIGCHYLSHLGIAFSICFPGFILGLVSALPASSACLAVARQPFYSQKIIRFMLITLSLIQTPIIFGFIISLFIQNQSQTIVHLKDALRLIAAGFAVGLGSTGPAYGLATFAQAACYSLGVNPKAYNQVFSFTLISEAIIETPVIFSLVISVLLLFTIPITSETNIIQGIGFLAAAICAGIGTIGAGISSGKTAAAACKQIALNPQEYGVLSRTSMFAQGLIETSAIYPILVGILLIFMNR